MIFKKKAKNDLTYAKNMVYYKDNLQDKHRKPDAGNGIRRYQNE